MGTYYELKVDIILKPIDEIGQDIHTLLTRLFNQPALGDTDGIIHDSKDSLPQHPFWTECRFSQIGEGGYSQGVGDNEEASYEHPVVKLRTYIKYGHREILSFLDWLTPYVDSVPEPGVYYIEGSDEYDLNYSDVMFEVNPEGKKSFLLIEHYTTGKRKQWVTLPPEIK